MIIKNISVYRRIIISHNMKKEHNVFGFGFFSSMETGTKLSEFHNGEKTTVVQILSK